MSKEWNDFIFGKKYSRFEVYIMMPIFYMLVKAIVTYL